MERITNRTQLAILHKTLRIANDGFRFTFAESHGNTGRHTNRWGREAEGDAAVGLISASEIEHYVTIGPGGVPNAEVRLLDLIDWAGSDDPQLLAKVASLRDEVAALRRVVTDQERQIQLGDEGDRLLTWPVWEDYESEASWAEEYALRCMANTPAGNKILPGGKPQLTRCRAIVNGENILEQLTWLREHVATVEHVTEPS